MSDLSELWKELEKFIAWYSHRYDTSRQEVADRAIDYLMKKRCGDVRVEESNEHPGAIRIMGTHDWVWCGMPDPDLNHDLEPGEHREAALMDWIAARHLEKKRGQP